MIKSKFIKKIIIMFGILSVQGVLLYGFYYNENLIFNFKTAYLKQVYLPSYAYSFDNIKSDAVNNLANVSAIFGRNNFNEIVSLSNQENELIAKSIPVLLYHGVIENPDGSNILLEDFRDQMFALKKAGWQTVSIEDFYQFMKGEKILPDKSFLLTFDDGRKDSYYPVDPILKALDYNAVIFIVTKYSLKDKSGNYYLSKKELERMTGSGRWEIEAHTRDGHNIYKIAQDGKQGHFYTNKLWLDNEDRLETEEEFKNRITADFVVAKNDIEYGLGAKVISFAFPFGDFGQDSVNFPEAGPIILNAAKSIYSLAFYQVWPGKGYSFNYPNKDFLIKRIDVKPDWGAEVLLTLLDVGREKPLPYFDNFEKYNGWIKTWGSLTLGNNSMILGATDLNNGGAVFLDGPRLWENYSFSTKIDWLKGRNISLLARYKDNKNYAACNFSEDGVRIEQRLKNKNRAMVEVKHDFSGQKNDLELEIRVNRDKIECFLNGEIAAYAYYLSPILSNGGIGFKIWDPMLGNSEIIVKEVSIEEIK